jgi:hypothetical protein
MMHRYYPKWSTVVVLPLVGAFILGRPFLHVVWGPVRTIAVFVVVIGLCRYLSRVEFVDGKLRGRSPRSLRWMEIPLAEVVSVEPTRPLLSGTAGGWSFSDSHGNAVFVNQGALVNDAIRSRIPTA